MNTMTAEQAANQITRAYNLEMAQTGQHREWVKVTALAARLDLTLEQLTAGARHLARNGWTVAPTSNQKTLTDLDRKYALWIGGQFKHVITRN